MNPLHRMFYYFRILFLIFSALFMLYVSYQILKIIAGGSWAFEIAILTVVLGNTALTVGLAYKIGSIQADIGVLRGEIRGEIGGVKAEFYKALAEFSAELRKELHSLDKRVARIEHKLKIR